MAELKQRIAERRRRRAAATAEGAGGSLGRRGEGGEGGGRPAGGGDALEAGGGGLTTLRWQMIIGWVGMLTLGGALLARRVCRPKKRKKRVDPRGIPL